MILIWGDQSTWRKTCPSVTLSTSNRAQTGVGLNLSLCHERPVTNHLNYGIAQEGFCRFVETLQCNIKAGCDNLWICSNF